MLFKINRHILRAIKVKYNKRGKSTSALRYDPREKCLEIIEKTTLECVTPNTALVKVVYAGVSGTDLKILNSGIGLAAGEPRILGHEICGRVAAPRAGHLKCGDCVVVNPTQGCQVCAQCRNKAEHYCARVECAHVGINSDGGWQHYCEIPHTQLHPIPAHIQLADAILVHPLSCVRHAWDLLQPVARRSRILIVGAGFAGNLFAAFFHFNGYRDVTVCETNIRKFNITAKLCTGYELVTPDALKRVKLYDVIVDCTGCASAVEKAVELLNYGGTFCVFGIVDADARINLSPYEVFRKELRIFAPKYGPYSYPDAFALVEAMCPRYINYAKLGMGFYKLCDYKHALTCLRRGDIAKIVFCFDEPENTKM